MKFSGNKRSGMENMIAKFRCPKMVAMETVTDSLLFFNARYLSRGQGITLKFWEFVLQEQSYSLYSEHIFLRLTEFQL